MTLRPKLLFLCHTFPYPPDGGIWIRTYHVLRLLARAFDIVALCFERPPRSGGAAYDVDAGKKALAPFAAIEAFPVPQRHSRLRYVWDHLRSAALRRVYTAYLYDSRSFHRRLGEIVESNTFDLVHLDSLDLAEYLPACHDLRTICAHPDVESANLRRRAAIERGPWRKAYVLYQAGLRQEAERHWCNRITLNTVVSEHDRALLKRVAPLSRVAVIPNGVSVDEFRPDSWPGSGVAFVGGIDWLPNRDALDFLCEAILPHIRARRTIDVRWIGTASAEQRRYYGSRYGIELTGYVKDVRPFMRQAACHIVPLRSGGGTRLKILNSWAMGKPVVATSIGCEGLAAVDGDNILIRDDPKAFADALLAVLEQRELSRCLGERGRATVERLYSWDVIGRDLIDIYQTLAAVRT